uniref:Uncharacterized protein n=1 Tax=Panagrolaimus superbus TaxID=310955 RepID=A0A914YN73_9BILA
MNECLNKWCEFSNADIAEIKLPFQIHANDYYEVKTDQRYLKNFVVTFFISDKSKWFISNFFHEAATDSGYSIYYPYEYYGGIRSDKSDNCGYRNSRLEKCESEQECKILLAFDTELQIARPSLSIKDTKYWKYFSTITLGGSKELIRNNEQQIIKFKYVASDTTLRQKPLPYNDEINLFLAERRRRCLNGEIDVTISPTTLSTIASTSKTAVITSASTTTPTMTTKITTPSPSTTSTTSTTTKISTFPTIPTTTTTTSSTPTGTAFISKTTTTTTPNNEESGTDESQKDGSTTMTSNNEESGTDESQKDKSTKTIPNNEESKKDNVAAAGSWFSLTKKDTWTANKNGWIGPYANRNRALIYVFGNCIILAAFFITLSALIFGGCLFNQTLNDSQQTIMSEFYDHPPQLNKF